MADRVVQVSLRAVVNNYAANMEAARKSTVKVTDSLEAQKKASIDAAKAQGEASAKIGAGFMAVGALAAVGVGLAVKKFADFDQAISNVKAATQESSENMGLLRDAALEAGATTVYSATEAAGAIEELGKAGLSTTDILNGGLDGALSLAAAGGIGVAEAAGIAATALKTFQLEGQDMSHVADLLAAGSGKAMGEVTDLAGALGQAGLVANATGLSIEETTGTLAAFASKGLLGSDAGTSFKAMLQRLTPQSKEAADKMAELGISAYDAQGNFIGMEKFAGNLQSSLKDLSVEERNTAMSTIFGSDAVRAATVLYDEGAKGIGKWTDQVDDSGYAAKVAADRLDNLKGDAEALGGAFDTFLIQSGSGANDSLRALTQGATGLVAAVGGMPTPVLNGALAFGGLVAAVGLAGGAALIAVPKFAAMKTGLQTLGISAGTAAKGVGLLSGGLAVAGVAFAIFAARQAEATARTAEFKDSLDPITGAVTDYTRELVVSGLTAKGAYGNAMKAAGISQKELTDAVVDGGDKLDAVKKKLGAENTFLSFFDGTGIAAGNASAAINDLAGDLDRSEGDWKDTAAATDEVTVANENVAESYATAAGKADELQASIKSVLDIMNEANGVAQDAVAANADYQEGIAGITADVKSQKEAYEEANGSLAGFTLNLDESTAAGSANAASLSDVAGSAQDAAKAQYDLDLKTMSAKDASDKYLATLGLSREALIKAATAAGYNADEIQVLIDRVYAMPTAAEIDILADTADAQARLQRIQDLINGIGRTKNLHISTGVGGTGGMTKAEGGAIYGPGTGTSDSIPAWLSNGEHVLTAQEVARMGGQGAVYRFRQSIGSGNTPRFATGGAVQYVPASSGFGGGGNSTTTNNGGSTFHITQVGDPNETAAKIDGRLNYTLRSS